MRHLALLLVFALLVGCGEKEPDFSNQKNAGPDGSGETTGETPKKPDRPEPQKASPEASQLNNAYRMAKNARSPKKVALDQLSKWEGKTVPPDALYFLGLLHQYAEQWGTAADTFAAFVQKAPEDTNAKWGLYTLVDCLIKADRASDAGKYVTTFGQKYPEEAEYWRSMESTLAAALAEKGKLEEAAPHYAKAFELGDYYAGEEWVMVLAGIGKYDEARAAAKKLDTIADGEKEQARAKEWVDRTEKMGKPAPEMDIAVWAHPEGYDPTNLEGRVRVVYFWTTGDQSASLKHDKAMKPIWDKYASGDFMIIGVSKPDHYDFVERKKHEDWTLEDEVKNLGNWVFNSKRWLDGTETPWVLALARDAETQEAYGYAGINPTFVVIDKKGNYRYYRQGHDPKGYVQLDYVVGRLLKE